MALRSGLRRLLSTMRLFFYSIWTAHSVHFGIFPFSQIIRARFVFQNSISISIGFKFQVLRFTFVFLYSYTYAICTLWLASFVYLCFLPYFPKLSFTRSFFNFFDDDARPYITAIIWILLNAYHVCYRIFIFWSGWHCGWNWHSDHRKQKHYKHYHQNYYLDVF